VIINGGPSREQELGIYSERELDRRERLEERESARNRRRKQDDPLTAAIKGICAVDPHHRIEFPLIGNKQFRRSYPRLRVVVDEFPQEASLKTTSERHAQRREIEMRRQIADQHNFEYLLLRRDQDYTADVRRAVTNGLARLKES
jgi:hypothetical protein